MPAGGRLAPTLTHAAHLAPNGVEGRGPPATAALRSPYETSPAGNEVVLEQQLMQVTETAVQHRLAQNVYAKHLAMIRTAVGAVADTWDRDRRRMDLSTALQISAAGMKAQGTRLRVIAENLANAQSIGEGAGRRALSPPGRDLPRRVRPGDRRHSGEVSGVADDPSTFPRRYEPSHPGRRAEGYVTYTNVNTLMR